MLPRWASALQRGSIPRLVLPSLGSSSTPGFSYAVRDWIFIPPSHLPECGSAGERPSCSSTSSCCCCGYSSQRALYIPHGAGRRHAEYFSAICKPQNRRGVHCLAALRASTPDGPEDSTNSCWCSDDTSTGNNSSYTEKIGYDHVRSSGSSSNNHSSPSSSSGSTSSSVQPVAVSSLPNNSAAQSDGETPLPSVNDGGRSPQALVGYLDEYIVGQKHAKTALAVALRQRWRRRQVKDPALRRDICPRNILLIGPTGVGKTEIARRLAALLDAPFLKVEATKYTEVGFHGRDVEQIIKDLMEVAVKQKKLSLEKKMKIKAEEKAEAKVLNALLGKIPAEEYKMWLRHLRCGALDSQRVEVDLPLPSAAGAPNTRVFDEAEDAVRDRALSNISTLFTSDLRMMERRCVSVKEAIRRLTQAELDAMITKDMVVQQAIEAVEEEGIVFIDEIDKICSKSGRGGYHGPDASDEGVQRDLLPLLEGSTVSTRYGEIKTNYILFIASGAFHSVQPSDMLAELQGRLPVRVFLKPLSEEDFYQIMTKTKHNLIEQHKALLATEGVELKFRDDAIAEVAKVASEINSHVENIGARRLHTIIEKVLEDINLNAALQPPGTTVLVDRQRVIDSVKGMRLPFDPSRFML